MIKKEPTLKSRNSIIMKLTGQTKETPEVKATKTKEAKTKVVKKKATKPAAPAEKKIKTSVTPKATKETKATATKKKASDKVKTPKAPTVVKAPKAKKEVATKAKAKAKAAKKREAETPTITAQVLADFSFAPAVISTNQINIDYFITKLRTIADLQDDTNYRLQVLTEELETLQTNLKNKGE